jgi:hypothetical protein
MTTFAESGKNCFVCGETNKYIELTSSNRFGAPDLDTRPPEMMRSTIYSWIQACPYCDYCAPDISEGTQIAARVIKFVSQKRYKMLHG